MPTMIEGINFYTIKETAQAIGLSEITIRRYLKNGMLPHTRLVKNGKILITETNIKDAIEKRSIIANLKRILK